MRTMIVAIAVLAGGVTPASAVDDYDSCLSLVGTDPQAAVRDAGEWARFHNGGAAARHCYALALLEIGAASRAIDELLGIAAEEPALDDAARADILVQAGELLIQDGDTLTAAVVSQQALRLSPNGAGALGLRASLRIAKSDYAAAVADLSEAITKDGATVRLLSLRASAHRQMGELIPARDDASYATELDPDDPSAWLELGRIEARIGDKASARQSLLTAIGLDRDGEIGEAAQNVLQRMEAGVE